MRGESDSRLRRTERAGRYLQHLIETDPYYRRAWLPRERRDDGRPLSQAAVARVLLEYLINEEGLDRHTDVRKLRDKVSRAFSGRALTAATLATFIAAFDMSESHAEELSKLLAGDLPVSQAHGLWVAAPEYRILPREVETVSIDETHHIGSDRMPVLHETRQVVRAIVDGATHYTFRFDTDAALVTALEGCAASSLYVVDAKSFGVDLQFDEALRVGETAAISYRTEFSYRDPTPPEFRRAMATSIKALTLRLIFDRRCLPKRVVWGQWDDPEGTPVSEEVVQLGPRHSVHRHLEGVTTAVVGFFWTW